MQISLRFGLLFLIGILQCISLQAQIRESDYYDTRPDSIDILHYTIDLNLLEDNQNKILASTLIRFRTKTNQISRIVLDLKGYTIDSVKFRQSHVSYQRQGEKIRIQFPEPLNNDQLDSVQLWYGGSPFVNIQDFGRFYISPGFSYNIGVSFLEDPHNFGRAWFPCFDNFTERSTFTCRISTRPDLLGYAGGVLVQDTLLADRRVRTWEMNQEIPTYLASAASAAFSELKDKYLSSTGREIPVILAAVPADTALVKSAFANLKPVFHLFEAHFGPYRWDRIGYVFVPFMAGAMEHATNIAFPRALLSSGAEGCNHIMAHELAHHWFGNLVTCRTASEMWLNEGFSKYTEFLFDEWMSGKAAYNQSVRQNHRELLIYNHVRNGGYHRLSNIPTNYTYSELTYELPADILHNLRSYSGDSLFFAGLRHYLDKYAFQPVTSDSLLSSMKSVGVEGMDEFFNDWVNTPGWPHFSIDSLRRLPQNQWKVFFRQKSNGNMHNYQKVPFTISFRDAESRLEERSVKLSGPLDSAIVTLPFEPIMAYLNRDEKTSFAVTGEEHFIKVTGNVNWPEAFVEIDTRSISDSAFLRVEHHFVGPDAIPGENPPYKLSPNRYWKVYGTMPEGFHARAKWVYNGRKPSPLGSMGNGWLDTGFTYDERLITLLYRKDSRDNWKPAKATQSMLASVVDMYGYFMLDTLLPGEYSFAETLGPMGLQDKFAEFEEANPLHLFPNPASGDVNILLNLAPGNQAMSIEIRDLQGRIVLSQNLSEGTQTCSLNTSGFAPGVYLLGLVTSSGDRFAGKLILTSP